MEREAGRGGSQVCLVQLLEQSGQPRRPTTSSCAGARPWARGLDHCVGRPGQPQATANASRQRTTTARQHRSLAPLKIRGKVVWFDNSSRSVGLALMQGLEIQQLEWFMDELLHDIEEMQDQEEGPGPGPGSQALRKHALDKILQDLVDESLKPLQEHHKCQCAYYLSSRK